MLATGARHAYFGHDEWEPFAPGLKTLEDATTIRRRILLAFEKAERETDPERRQALMTFVIIGGGPTGVELAGTIAELARDTLAGEFRNIDTGTARVVLIEAGERVLAGFKPELSAYAKKALERLGVTVELGRAVTDCNADGVTFGGQNAAGRRRSSGRRASPHRRRLNGSASPADRVGRIIVEPDLTVPGHPEIFAIGDTAHVELAGRRAGAGHCAGSQAAGQACRRRRSGRGWPATTRRRPFRYRHDGDLATIGKRAAAIDFGWIKLTGWIAWWMWGIAHIYFLIGLRNRLAVSLSWLWIYVTGQRSARLITQGGDNEEDEDKAAS